MPHAATQQTALDTLGDMRAHSGARQTQGLSDQTIARFAETDTALRAAIEQASELHAKVRAQDPAALASTEADLCTSLQADYVNFYAPVALNPYVALAAKGPWVVTTHGAVIYDTGGYGMLGAGQEPDQVLEAMSAPAVMANVMTPSLVHKRFAERLWAELGHSRTTSCPYSKLLCMNSGSESVTVALRIADRNAWLQTQKEATHAGKTIALASLRGAFHGRTDRPAQASHSTLPTYKQHLASFRDRDNLCLIEPNDVAGLHATFDQAERENVFIEALLVEPVMGEGNPGLGLTRAFYDAARERTTRMGSLLIVDSIQAGLRAHGVLSVIDYPGFQNATAPDMETFSKALNAGQYPLSVLVMTSAAADLYVTGTYGNTMTTTPRALNVATAVLSHIDDAMRANIRERGLEFVAKLEQLASDFPNAITGAQGTGLLVCAKLADTYAVVAERGLERLCRERGLGVIHGGKNGLRFTPHFHMTSAEIDLVIAILRDALEAYGRS